jgi:hypothetical protein
MYSNLPKIPSSNFASLCSNTIVNRSLALASLSSSRIHGEAPALVATATTRLISPRSLAITLSSIRRGSNCSAVTHTICIASRKRFNRSTWAPACGSPNLNEIKQLIAFGLRETIFSSLDIRSSISSNLVRRPLVSFSHCKNSAMYSAQRADCSL